MSTLMIDATGNSAGNIPPGTPVVAGYVTGTGGVEWSAADWARFPHAGHVRIDQSPTRNLPLLSDVADYEPEAITFDELLAWLGARWALKWWSTVYVDQADLAGVQAAVATADLTRVQYWLADWSLNEAEAEARLQPNLDGGIVAVQWASPSSNPRTLVPGSSLTLAEANVDLSVTVDGWYRP